MTDTAQTQKHTPSAKADSANQTLGDYLRARGIYPADEAEARQLAAWEDADRHRTRLSTDPNYYPPAWDRLTDYNIAQRVQGATSRLERARAQVERFQNPQTPRQKGALTSSSRKLREAQREWERITNYQALRERRKQEGTHMENAEENKSITLLQAAERGQTETIRRLIENGADVNATGYRDWTALMYVAQQEGQTDTARLLIEHGADVNAASKHGWTALISAASNGHTDTAHLLIQHGADVNATRENGWTALMAAASNDHTNTALLLIEHGADVNAASETGLTPLMYATLNGNPDPARLLIENGADVNAADEDDETPLMFAAQKGQTDTARLLIESGANVNTAAEDGWTPLMYAARYGHTDPARLLIEHGADVNVASDTGWTPLMYAAQEGHIDPARLLIEHGADVNAAGSFSRSALMNAAQEGRIDTASLLIEHGADVNAATEDGWTPLMYAAWGDHTHTVRLLIEHGADVNAADSLGKAALMYAAQEGHIDTARLLIEHGANVNNAARETGWTPLMFATARNTDAARLLIEHGANVNNAARETGWTPLMYAARWGRIDTARLLIERGASVNDADEDGWTPLMFAARWGRIDAARLLIEHGADINITNKDGQTALMVAAEHGHDDISRLIEQSTQDANTAAEDDDVSMLMNAAQEGNTATVRQLIENGADVNAAAEDGWTPLMFAAQEGHTDTARLLIENGANVNVATNVGWTPLMYVARLGRTDTVRLLIEHGANVNAATEDGWTALMFAAEHGHADIARLLAEHDADERKQRQTEESSENMAAAAEPHISTQDANTAAEDDDVSMLMNAAQEGNTATVRQLIENGADVNAADRFGRTALMSAAVIGDTDTARLLIEHGANVDTADGGFNWTALMYAAWNGQTDTARLLIESGADVNTVDEDGDTPLIAAARQGHADAARLLIESGADVNVSGDTGWTPLMAAAWHGQTDTPRLLIESGADVNAANDGTGWTPLVVAAQRGHTDIAHLLIEHGADVNTTSEDGWTPLKAAVWHGKTDAARLLIENGADVNTTSEDGWTPLIFAARYGHTDTARLLIEHGANVNDANDDGRTPLMYAALWGRIDTTRLLIEHGADINITSKDGKTALRLAAEHGHDDISRLIEQSTQDANTAAKGDNVSMLMNAAQNGNTATVRQLIKHGVDVNAIHRHGITPLMEACARGHTDTARLLIESGANVNAVDDDDKTALMYAAQEGYIDAARLLIEHGASVNDANEDGWTPLMYAAREDRSHAARLLIKHGADVNAANGLGWTSLMIATDEGHIYSVRLLIERGANVNAADSFGRTALMYAAQEGYPDIARQIIEHGANVDAPDKDGWTALMLAAARNTDIARLLIEHGANVNAATEAGWTPLMYAAREGHTDAARLLIKHGADINITNKDGQTALTVAAEHGHKDIARLIEGKPYISTQDEWIVNRLRMYRTQPDDSIRTGHGGTWQEIKLDEWMPGRVRVVPAIKVAAADEPIRYMAVKEGEHPAADVFWCVQIGGDPTPYGAEIHQEANVGAFASRLEAEERAHRAYVIDAYATLDPQEQAQKFARLLEFEDPENHQQRLMRQNIEDLGIPVSNSDFTEVTGYLRPIRAEDPEILRFIEDEGNVWSFRANSDGDRYYLNPDWDGIARVRGFMLDEQGNHRAAETHESPDFYHVDAGGYYLQESYSPDWLDPDSPQWDAPRPHLRSIQFTGEDGLKQAEELARRLTAMDVLATPDLEEMRKKFDRLANEENARRNGISLSHADQVYADFLRELRASNDSDTTAVLDDKFHLPGGDWDNTVTVEDTEYQNVYKVCVGISGREVAVFSPVQDKNRCECVTSTSDDPFSSEELRFELNDTPWNSAVRLANRLRAIDAYATLSAPLQSEKFNSLAQRYNPDQWTAMLRHVEQATDKMSTEENDMAQEPTQNADNPEDAPHPDGQIVVLSGDTYRWDNFNDLWLDEKGNFLDRNTVTWRVVQAVGTLVSKTGEIDKDAIIDVLQGDTEEERDDLLTQAHDEIGETEEAARAFKAWNDALTEGDAYTPKNHQKISEAQDAYYAARKESTARPEVQQRWQELQADESTEYGITIQAIEVIRSAQIAWHPGWNGLNREQRLDILRAATEGTMEAETMQESTKLPFRALPNELAKRVVTHIKADVLGRDVYADAADLYGIEQHYVWAGRPVERVEDALGRRWLSVPGGISPTSPQAIALDALDDAILSGQGKDAAIKDLEDALKRIGNMPSIPSSYDGSKEIPQIREAIRLLAEDVIVCNVDADTIKWLHEAANTDWTEGANLPEKATPMPAQNADAEMTGETYILNGESYTNPYRSEGFWVDSQGNRLPASEVTQVLDAMAASVKENGRIDTDFMFNHLDRLANETYARHLEVAVKEIGETEEEYQAYRDWQYALEKDDYDMEGEQLASHRSALDAREEDFRAAEKASRERPEVQQRLKELLDDDRSDWPYMKQAMGMIMHSSTKMEYRPASAAAPKEPPQMPSDWNGGELEVQASVTLTSRDGKEHVVPAANLGVEPEFWAVYARLKDGTAEWVRDFDTQHEAMRFADQQPINKVRRIGEFITPDDVGLGAEVEYATTDAQREGITRLYYNTTGKKPFDDDEVDGYKIKQVDFVEGQWWVRGQLTPNQATPPTAADMPVSELQAQVEQYALRNIEVRQQQQGSKPAKKSSSTPFWQEKEDADHRNKKWADDDLREFHLITTPELRARAAAVMLENRERHPVYRTMLEYGSSKTVPRLQELAATLTQKPAPTPQEADDHAQVRFSYSRPTAMSDEEYQQLWTETLSEAYPAPGTWPQHDESQGEPRPSTTTQGVTDMKKPTSQPANPKMEQEEHSKKQPALRTSKREPNGENTFALWESDKPVKGGDHKFLTGHVYMGEGNNREKVPVTVFINNRKDSSKPNFLLAKRKDTDEDLGYGNVNNKNGNADTVYIKIGEQTHALFVNKPALSDKTHSDLGFTSPWKNRFKNEDKATDAPKPEAPALKAQDTDAPQKQSRRRAATPAPAMA